MGGGVVGSAVGITFSAGDTPASDTPRLLPEKMFTSLTKKETNTIRLREKKIQGQKLAANETERGK